MTIEAPGMRNLSPVSELMIAKAGSRVFVSRELITWLRRVGPTEPVPARWKRK